jgi:hypothetical protein
MNTKGATHSAAIKLPDCSTALISFTNLIDLLTSRSPVILLNKHPRKIPASIIMAVIVRRTAGKFSPHQLKALASWMRKNVK